MKLLTIIVFFFFSNVFINGDKVLLAGTRQFSAEVLFGSSLHMLHQPGKEL